ncbi:hypothetical protein [Acanthopleuribacter pedis]|uniref:Uncharacterized protein n=1 Tax=Acanthopleuribacter pedis TaxID=442870 RepID=A0A8J7QFY1_9BACT|nr:hypothetical protein [Acanthopleuribacter pedis]MBO1317770.1 hypothetical protein [Acanthopleuribacter pedis]
MSRFTFLQQIVTGFQGMTPRGADQTLVAAPALPFAFLGITRRTSSRRGGRGVSAENDQIVAKASAPVSDCSQVAVLDAKLALVPKLRERFFVLMPSQMVAAIDQHLNMTPEEKGLARCGMDPAAVLSLVAGRLERERIAAEATH